MVAWQRDLGLGLVVCFALACGSKSGGAEEGDSADSQSDDESTTGGNESQSSSDPDTGEDGNPTGNPTTDPSGSDSADEGDFISEPDGGVTGECDPMAQGCPEGEKCTAYSNIEGEPWNANKCVEDTGDGQVGDPCDIEGGKYTGEDNCDIGLICLLTDDDGNGGACVEFCDANMQCPGGGSCSIYNDGSLPICLTNCDPLAPDCPEGQGCYTSAGSNEFVCFKYSGMNGEGAPGDECNFLNQCQPGTACLAPASVEGCASQAGCCSLYCDLSDPDPEADCNPTEVCEVVLTDPPPQYADVGVCAVPGM